MENKKEAKSKSIPDIVEMNFHRGLKKENRWTFFIKGIHVTSELEMLLEVIFAKVVQQCEKSYTKLLRNKIRSL